jgi:hypothetical protein
MDWKWRCPNMKPSGGNAQNLLTIIHVISFQILNPGRAAQGREVAKMHVPVKQVSIQDLAREEMVAVQVEVMEVEVAQIQYLIFLV